MTNHVENVAISPEQQELEAARTERAEIERQAEEARLRAAELEKENRELRGNQNLRTAIKNCGLRWDAPTDMLIKLLPENMVEFDADGNLVGDIREKLRAFAFANPYLTSLESQAELHKDEKLIRSRADLRTNEERSAFIKTHGLVKFEALPSRPTASIDIATMSAREYRALPQAVKSALIKQHGEATIGQIMCRKEVE